MKIVHTEASCGWGGQELRILSEAAGMIARGHAVQLLCPPEARIFTEAPRHGVPVTALPIGRKNVAGLLALRGWLARHDVDVLNSHSSTDSWLAALACATLGGAPPLVRTRHISAPVPRNAATRWLYTRATQHVVTTGESLRRSLIDDNGFPAGNVTSVPTGIDTQRFRPAADAAEKAALRSALGLDPAGRYVGILATLRSWKGHAFLLDALAASGRRDWKLLIVGDGPQRAALAARIAELGLGEIAFLVGHKDDAENWLRALDAFCLPSYANEGVPQSVIQAMLTALPIVTTPVGAITEAIEDGRTGLIVPPRNAERLAAAIARLTAEPELGTTLGAAARREALNRFSREAMLDHMELIMTNAHMAERSAMPTQ